MVAVAAFVIGAAVSLVTSWVLVSRLERVGERLSFSEAMLGIVAALAADAPEITAAVSALTSRQQSIGAGVVLGSNVFNLAALLGLGAVVAGCIRLHRKVVVLGGTVALAVALISLLVVSGVIPPLAGLVIAVPVLAAYLAALGTGGKRLHLPARWQTWLRSAVSEEELELEDAIRPRRGGWPDAFTAAIALAVVIVASVTMERAASSLGRHLGIPEIITGGLILAAVTSLPNAVAAVYLASRGRGAATLSTALNSNTLNVVAGLLLPGAVLGLGQPNGQAVLVTAWYAGLTLAVLGLAWRYRGLTRRAGAAIIAAYVAFTASLIAVGYATPGNRIMVLCLTAVSSLILLVATRPAAGRRGPDRDTPPGSPESPGQEGPDAPAEASSNAHNPPGCAQPGLVSRPSAGLPSWPVRRTLALSMITAAAVAAADAATGHRVILIGLLVAGPLIAQLTGSWRATIVAGAWACGLAVVLGVPDGIWATGTHITFMTVVALMALVATAGATMIGCARR